MEVICLQDEAFYKLLDRVVEYVKDKHEGVKEDPWINELALKKMLGVKSKTTLQKLRDEGKIEFSKTGTKTIMYKTASVHAYLNEHLKRKF